MRRISSSPTGLRVLYVSLSRGFHAAASEGSRLVRVSVWWDLENCNVPTKTNIFRVTSAISAAVRATGISGPMEITAFGDMIQLARIKQEGLSATGVNLAHVPRNGKNSADRSILANLMYWVSQNPPPAHLFLISGDKDFAGIMHRLRMSNYNILLASPEENSRGVLFSAASVVWNWHDLLRGENLAGKCFNQPPDGPYHLWYGRYKGPLLDPFTDSEDSEEPKSGSEIHLPLHLGTPSIVRRRIRQILKLNHPDGILISDLRNELGKDESFDKENYYGYRRFIPFLLSMQNDILRIIKGSSGQYVAYYISHSTRHSGSGFDRKSFEDGDAKKTQQCSKEKAKEKDRSRSAEDVIRMTEVSSDKKIAENTGDSEEPKSGSEIHLPLHLGTPNNVRRQIRRILKSNHPDGILISDLRNELGKDETFDNENYYGYKRFITFLSSMENDILRIIEGSSGQYVAYYISHSTRHSESGFDRKSFEDGDAKKIQQCSAEKAKHKDRSRSAEDVIRMTEVSSDKKIAENPGDEKAIKVVDGDQKFAERKDLFHSGDEKIAEPVKSLELGSKFPVLVQLEPSSKPGILRRFWRKWFGSESSGSDTKSSEGGIKLEEKYTIPKTTADFPSPPSHSSPLGEKASSESSEKVVANPGFADQIRSWFINTNTLETEKPSNRSFDEEKPITTHSMHKLFSQDSFWSIIETFMGTHRGSRLVSESKTRQEMAHELRRKGPYCLLPLEESDMSRLVDLLIEEKKWVEECPLEAFPFKLYRTKKSSTPESHLHEKDPNNLSSLFRSRGEEAKSPEDSSQSVGGSLTVRSKGDVLADCQSLVDEIMRENPRGFFVGLFRKKFIDTYGYHLDYQRLGYQGLDPLINNMSGVKIKSGCIISEAPPPKNGDGFTDSNWEELGPITDSRPSFESQRAKTEVDYEYEPAVSEDELSERDETCSVKKKLGEEVEDSSLLRILDSWHESKLSDTRKKKHRTKKGISFVLEAKESDKEREWSKLADNVQLNIRTLNEAPSEKEKEKVLCQ